mmetsp:Transcript_20121/g.17241  ORF Transcript_20121/g.17241 Transcript_20121/m.17241 type:complete len:111 (-) Transcript_20121:435-767(-)
MSTINVVLNFISQNKVEHIRAVEACFQPNEDLDLSSVLSSLKQKGYPLNNLMIFFYSYGEDTYIYCGKDPVPRPLNIPPSSYIRGDGSKVLQIRVKEPENPIYRGSSSQQ